MNSGNLVTVSAGLLILLLVAETASFVFKVHSQRFYVAFHLVGGALVYLFFLILTQNKFFSLGLVLTIGLLWEFHEWVLWKFFLKKRVYKPGGGDTRNDLLMDLLGALSIYVIQIL